MNDNLRERLIYGTYKLPQKYEEFSGILSFCTEQGIKWIDSASLYNKGLSESWIGRWQESNQSLNVSTKAGKFYNNLGRLIVSNNYFDILHSVKISLQRLKQPKLELLFIHDYESGRTNKEISDLIDNLLSSGLIKKIGLSNFPLKIIKTLEVRNKIFCLQVNYNSESLRDYVSLHDRNGIQLWIYRPFNQGKIIAQRGKKPEEVINELAEEFPNCNFVFGASRLEQLAWLEGL